MPLYTHLCWQGGCPQDHRLLSLHIASCCLKSQSGILAKALQGIPKFNKSFSTQLEQSLQPNSFMQQIKAIQDPAEPVSCLHLSKRALNILRHLVGIPKNEEEEKER